MKGGSAFDKLAACDTVALDKTGTITTGSLTLTERVALTVGKSEAVATSSVSLHSDADGPARNGANADSGTSREELAMLYAVALSRMSSHPVSRAMTEYGDAHKLGEVNVTHFEQVSGGDICVGAAAMDTASLSLCWSLHKRNLILVDFRLLSPWLNAHCAVIVENYPTGLSFLCGDVACGTCACRERYELYFFSQPLVMHRFVFHNLLTSPMRAGRWFGCAGPLQS